MSLKQDGEDALLTVRDTGTGITPEFAPHVFERYSQGTDPSHTPGLGLGLCIVAQIVKLHGGTVTVASPGLGQGSAFTVRLPLRKSDEEGTSHSLPLTAPPTPQEPS
jgi:signal transduction histidine kinase